MDKCLCRHSSSSSPCYPCPPGFTSLGGVGAVCTKATTTLGPSIQSTSTYTLKTSGYCTTYITTIGECERAAVALNLKDQTAVWDDQTGRAYDPTGCYFEDGLLKLNDYKNEPNFGRCSSSDKCLCVERSSSSSSAVQTLYIRQKRFKDIVPVHKIRISTKVYMVTFEVFNSVPCIIVD